MKLNKFARAAPAALFYLLLLPALHGQMVTGNITRASTACVEAAGCVAVDLPNSGGGNYTGSASILLTGTWTATVQFEGSADGSTWDSVSCIPMPTGTAATSATGNDTWQCNVAALSAIRVRGSAYTSGTAVVSIRYSPAIAKSIFGPSGGGAAIGGTLTATRVPFASGVSTLTDASGFTFVTDTLTFPKGVASTSLGIGTATPLRMFDSAGSGRFTGTASSTITGTADPTASTTLVGTGTLFTTELTKGDRITVSGETRMVTAIASDTSLTVNAAFTDTAAAAITRLPSLFSVEDSTNALKLNINNLGHAAIGIPAAGANMDTIPLSIVGTAGTADVLNIASATSADSPTLRFTNGTGVATLFRMGGGGTTGETWINPLAGFHVGSGSTTFAANERFTVATAGGVGVGDTTPVEGALTVGTDISAATYETRTACEANGTAANPSVVSCGSAAGGLFSCATAASTGTCQVNTTAVTANSIIVITPNAADGGASELNVTCNTASVLDATKPILLSKNVGVSFTINLGTVAVNPGCFEYFMVN